MVYYNIYMHEELFKLIIVGNKLKIKQYSIL